MATILRGPFVPGPNPVHDGLKRSSGESMFQTIYTFVCQRIDALLLAPIDLPVERALPRTKVALRAECFGTWGASRCLISDFGEGGLALVCGHPHQIGDVMRVRWVFGPQSLVGEVECEVRHVTGAHIGLRFLHASPGQRARIVESLRRACLRPHSSAA